jgi:hypothetical protein
MQRGGALRQSKIEQIARQLLARSQTQGKSGSLKRLLAALVNIQPNDDDDHVGSQTDRILESLYGLGVSENTLTYNHAHDFSAGGNQGNDLKRIYRAVKDRGVGSAAALPFALQSSRAGWLAGRRPAAAAPGRLHGGVIRLAPAVRRQCTDSQYDAASQ